MTPELEQQLIHHVSQNREALIGILADLVRCPSENTPPTGNERNCQQYLFDALQQGGYQPELYAIDEVPGLHAHPIYHAGRDYTGRPNLVARRQGGPRLGKRHLPHWGGSSGAALSDCPHHQSCSIQHSTCTPVLMQK